MRFASFLLGFLRILDAFYGVKIEEGKVLKEFSMVFIDVFKSSLEEWTIQPQWFSPLFCSGQLFLGGKIIGVKQFHVNTSYIHIYP